MKTRKVTSLKRWKLTRSEGPDDLTDFAKLWSSLSQMERLIYAHGIKGGFIQGYFDASTELNHARKRPWPDRESLSPRITYMASLDATVLINKVARLYRDPLCRTLPFHTVFAGAFNILEGTPKKEVKKELAKLKRLLMETLEPGQ